MRLGWFVSNADSKDSKAWILSTRCNFKNSLLRETTCCCSNNHVNMWGVLWVGLSRPQPFDAILAQGWSRVHTSMAQCAGGNCLARAPTELSLVSLNPDSSGRWPLVIYFLIGVFLVGVITGCFLCYIGSWVWTSLTKALQRSRTRPGPWAQLVARALHFIRRRRTISIAFRDLSSYTLRNTEASKPTTARRRRLTTPAPKARTSQSSQLTPLREGPVIHWRNGSHRSGT